VIEDAKKFFDNIGKMLVGVKLRGIDKRRVL